METDRTSLGDRQKQYEKQTESYLQSGVPVVIRIDGSHFHTWTKGLDKPVDLDFMGIMKQTLEYLMNNIENSVFGYTQSDEITIVMFDFLNQNTCPWFSNRVEKICSVVASLTTAAFNDFVNKIRVSNPKFTNKPLATFDTRVFNVPLDDLPNNILWRVQDAKRNSINSYAQSKFSHKELNKVNLSGALEMLKDAGVVWETEPKDRRFGTRAIISFDKDTYKKSICITPQFDYKDAIDGKNFYSIMSEYFNNLISKKGEKHE